MTCPVEVERRRECETWAMIAQLEASLAELRARRVERLADIGAIIALVLGIALVVLR